MKKVKGQNTTPSGEPHRKKKRRRRNLSLYYLMLLILVVIVGCVLSTTVLFRIQSITIVGTTRYTEEEILEACPIKVEDNLVRAKTKKAEEKLFASFGYVDSVEVKKVFPDQLEIILKPSVPYAYIKGEEGYSLVSAGNRILEISETPAGNEPVVKGYDPKPAEVGEMLSSLDEKKEKMFESVGEILKNFSDMKIDYVDISDRFNLVVRCENRINIELGSQVDLEYKMTFAKELIDNRLPKNKEGTVFIRNNKEASFVEKEDLEQYEKHYQENITDSGENTKNTQETTGEQ